MHHITSRHGHRRVGVLPTSPSRQPGSTHHDRGSGGWLRHRGGDGAQRRAAARRAVWPVGAADAESAYVRARLPGHVPRTEPTHWRTPCAGGQASLLSWSPTHGHHSDDVERNPTPPSRVVSTLRWRRPPPTAWPVTAIALVLAISGQQTGNSPARTPTRRGRQTGPTAGASIPCCQV